MAHWLDSYINKKTRKFENRGLVKFDECHGKNMPHYQLTVADLQYLAQRAPNLRKLNIRFCDLADEGLAALAGLTKLEELWVDETGGGGPRYAKAITDVGLASLAPLSKLRVLYLPYSKITDAGLAHCEPFEELETLGLFKAPITGTGLVHVFKQRKVKALYLQSTLLTDEGLLSIDPATLLGRAPMPLQMFLGGTRVTEAGFAHLLGEGLFDDRRFEQAPPVLRNKKGDIYIYLY